MTCLGDLLVKPPPDRILWDGSWGGDGSVEGNGARRGGGIAATEGGSETESPDQAHAWPAVVVGIGLILPVL